MFVLLLGLGFVIWLVSLGVVSYAIERQDNGDPIIPNLNRKVPPMTSTASRRLAWFILFLSFLLTLLSLASWIAWGFGASGRLAGMGGLLLVPQLIGYIFGVLMLDSANEQDNRTQDNKYRSLLEAERARVAELEDLLLATPVRPEPKRFGNGRELA